MMNLKSNAQKEVFNDGLCAIFSLKVRHDPIASLRLRIASRTSELLSLSDGMFNMRQSQYVDDDGQSADFINLINLNVGWV